MWCELLKYKYQTSYLLFYKKSFLVSLVSFVVYLGIKLDGINKHGVAGLSSITCNVFIMKVAG